MPTLQPKDKLANYMEEYASQMELNVWLQSTIERDPRWDPQTKRWTVKVLREGAEDREMKVPHRAFLSLIFFSDADRSRADGCF